MKDKNCSSCYYEENAECHLNPPVTQLTQPIDGEGGYIDTAYPNVGDVDWCSHHEDKA